jgi:hypothetical protein
MTYICVPHQQLQEQFQTCQYKLLQPLAQDKTQYTREHFQDYLNVIVHEDNSPYNFFNTLAIIFKTFHILDQGTFGIISVFYKKNFNNKQWHGGGN